MKPALLDCFRDLGRASLDFGNSLEHLVYDPKEMLVPLRDQISKLNQTRAYRPIHAPAESIENWKRYLIKRESDLHPRTVKYLCWEPDIATDIRFHNYLDQKQYRLRPQYLQGLVRACHLRWSSRFVDGPVIKRVTDRLLDYDGPNRLIQRWRSS